MCRVNQLFFYKGNLRFIYGLKTTCTCQNCGFGDLQTTNIGQSMVLLPPKKAVRLYLALGRTVLVL